MTFKANLNLALGEIERVAGVFSQSMLNVADSKKNIEGY